MVVKPQQLNPKGVFLALTDPNTLATTLHIILLSQYGEGIYDEDPMTLFMNLEDDFGAKPCEEAENRINAILMATSTELFYEDPHAFTAICETLTSGDPGIDVLESLTLPEILWTVFELELNRGPSDFSKSVMEVINNAVKTESQDTEEAGMVEDKYDYVTRYLADQRDLLIGQLKSIGLVNFQVPEIKSEASPDRSLNFL